MATQTNSRNVLLSTASSRVVTNQKSVVVSAPVTVFLYTSAGVLSDSTATIAITATRQNTTEPITWTNNSGITLYTAAVEGTAVSTPDTRPGTTVTVYVRASDFNTLNLNSLLVTATITDIDVFSNSLTITKLQPGSPGANGEYRDVIQLYLTSASPPTAPTSIPYTFSSNTIGTQTGGTAGWSLTRLGASTTPTYVITALAATTTPTIAVTLTAWSTPVIVAQNGTNGTSVYTATIYQKSANLPQTPTATASTYNFSTNVLTAPTGWDNTQPATNTTPTYACDYTFSGPAGSTVTGTGNWGTPYIEAVAGANGEYRDVIQLYLTSASPPTAPTSIPYTFSSNTIGTQTGGTAGWSLTRLGASTTPTYVITALAATTTPTIAVTLTAWSTPVIVAQNGTNGTSVYTATIYQKSANLPQTPTATASTYNFSTNVLTAPTGWSGIQPATTTTPTYASKYTFSGPAGSTVTGTGNWGTPYIEAVAGAPGAKYISVIAWRWANTPPTMPIADTPSIYNWSGATVNAYPTGWTPSASASPGGGYVLYQISVGISAAAADTTTAFNWNTATLNQLGFTPEGAIGLTGDSARIAYLVTTNPAVPGAVTAGLGDVVPTSPAGTWSFIATSILDPGYYMYQVDGRYSWVNNITTWGNPYLSNLKVGSLEALAVDTGNLTVSSLGSIKTAGKAYGSSGGFFMGNDGGTTKFSIGDKLLYNGSTLTVPAITISDNGILSGGGGGQVTIRGVGYTGDLNAAAGTRLVVSGTGLTLNGNSCDRPSSTGTWDAQCYSVDAYTGGAFCSFTAKNTISYFMAGLDTNPTANASYTNLDYAFYILPDGTLRIYESNIDIGSFGTYTGTDVLSVTYDGQFVRYAQNGTILRTVPADAGLKLYFDSSIINEGFRNIQFGPYSNTNTARGTNLIDPSWWKTGTNPAAYWNTTNDLTTPATDTTSTYTWATGAFTQPVVANGWYIQPGSVETTELTLWAVNTVIVDSGGPVSSTATWPRFQAPYIVGTATTTGSRTAVLDLYIWSSTVPTVFPSGTSTYTWSTAQFTAPATLNGWSIVPGTATAGQTLYVLTQIHINSTATTTSSVTWNATNPVAIKTADLTITRTGILKLYKWHNSAVNAPTSLFQGTDSFIPGTLPDNSTDTVWHSVSGNTNNTNPGGGWNPTTAATNSFPVNSSKTYMFAVYAKSVSSPVNSAGGVGYAFWGIDADAVCDLNTTTANTNPYFAYTNKVTGEWHLLVGYVYPAGTTGQNSATAGAYRCSDGVKITASTISANFTWKAATTVASTRCFQYYQAPGAEQQFAWPQVYLCDGTEPSIDDLLSMSVKNNIAAQNTTTFTGTNVTVNGKVFTKTTGTNQAWDAEVYSNDSYIGGAYSSVRVANITYLMFGLNSDPKTDSSYASLDYALYLTGDGNIYDYRNGTQFLLIGTYIVGDILAVTYDGVVVRYIKNGTVIGNPITVNITAPLFFDSSFRDIGGSLSNVQFGPLTSIGAVTATAASKLSKSAADTLTGPISLNAANAITVGNPALDSNPVTQAGKSGFYIGSTGIVATKNGVATVNISNTGDASFAGNLSAATGNFTGAVYGGAYTNSYTWPAAGSSGFYLGPQGLLLGSGNGTKYFQVTSDGNVYAPGFSVVNGSANFSGTLSASIVNTDQIVGNAASSASSTTTAGGTVSLTLQVPANASVILIDYYLGPPTSTGGNPGTETKDGVVGYVPPNIGPILNYLRDNGADVGAIIISPSQGTHTISISRSNYAGTMRLSAVVLKR